MNMTFAQFNERLERHVRDMTKGLAALYETGVDKDVLWATYLDSFPAGTNEIYRKRREYECSACRHFVKAMGHVVSIVNGKVTTIWDFETEDATFQPVLNALSALVKSATVTERFLFERSSFGTEVTREIMSDGRVRAWNHLHAEVHPSLGQTPKAAIPTKQGEWRTRFATCGRALREITPEAVQNVRELVGSNSLYRGNEWVGVLTAFAKLQTEFTSWPEAEKDLRIWEAISKAAPAVTGIRNSSIGTLLVDLSEGMDLDVAVRRYEAVVAPANYKRPQAVFTKKMLDDAKKALEADGLMPALARRFATLDDVSVRDVLFADRDAEARMTGNEDVFSKLEVKTTSTKHFSRLEQVPVEKFIADILPKCTKLEAFFESRLAGNLVSLIGASDLGAPPLFKWDNGFSWAYKGNVADSMKERVKAAGGKVDGVLRFSIQWNDGEKHNPNDLDAHCILPGGHIFYGRKLEPASGGHLDVDILCPQANVPAVENITFPDLARMREGAYEFEVVTFSNRGGQDGFRAEIEFDGQIHSFDVPATPTRSQKVATVHYSRKDGFRIEVPVPSSVGGAGAGKTIWGLGTGQYHPVTLMTLSPNYWTKEVGQKHFMFMLKNCVNEDNPNGFFNEFLREEFMKHKRVMEAIGGQVAVPDSQDQLSGLGFNSTLRNELIVKAHMSYVAEMKIIF